MLSVELFEFHKGQPHSGVTLFVTAHIRRIGEGNVFSLFTPGGGEGYPYPIMLCNITQNAMGQPGGYPARSSWGCTLPGGVPCPGGTLPGSNLPRGVGTLPGGVPRQVPPQVRTGRGTQLGQHREYLLHGGRYASCVHAGGLSCFH